MKVVALEQNTPEWMTWRNQHIGASDAPVIMDSSPYKTIRALFFEKKGLTVQDEEGQEFIFAKGHKTEKLIRAQFQELTGVEMKPLCIEHPNLSFVAASLDGYDSKLGVLEAKLVGKEVLNYAREKGQIPLHHLIQIQHQLETAEVDLGQWFGHDGKKDGVLIQIPRDKKMATNIIKKEQEFWKDLQDGRVPELSENDYLIPEDLSLLNSLREAKELADNAAMFYESLRQKVVESYKHPKLAGAGIKVFRVTREGSIDWKSIPEVQALDSEYLNKFRKAGSQSWSVIMDKKAVK